MPTPKKGEKEKDYVKRCMAYPDMQKYKPDQRVAVCHSMYKQHKAAVERGEAQDNDSGSS